MTKPKSKTELVRAAWITELRRQGHRQCTGDLFGGGNQVCALGLLAEVGGMTPDEADVVDFCVIGALAGLSGHQTDEVWWLNDGDTTDDDGGDGEPATFAEIADVVAAWFPS